MRTLTLSPPLRRQTACLAFPAYTSVSQSSLLSMLVLLSFLHHFLCFILPFHCSTVSPVFLLLIFPLLTSPILPIYILYFSHLHLFSFTVLPKLVHISSSIYNLLFFTSISFLVLSTLLPSSPVVFFSCHLPSL